LAVAARLAPLKTILVSSPTVAQKRMLLAGLAEIPDVEALELSERLLDETAVQAEAARAVINWLQRCPPRRRNQEHR